MSIQKRRKNAFSCFLLTRFWFFVRRTKIAITQSIFKIFAIKFFYMGPHYVDFTFAFDTTLIRLEMTEIWPKYFAPPWIGLNWNERYFSEKYKRSSTRPLAKVTLVWIISKNIWNLLAGYNHVSTHTAGYLLLFLIMINVYYLLWILKHQHIRKLYIGMISRNSINLHMWSYVHLILMDPVMIS